MKPLCKASGCSWELRSSGFTEFSAWWPFAVDVTNGKGSSRKHLARKVEHRHFWRSSNVFHLSELFSLKTDHFSGDPCSQYIPTTYFASSPLTPKLMTRPVVAISEIANSGSIGSSVFLSQRDLNLDSLARLMPNPTVLEKSSTSSQSQRLLDSHQDRICEDMPRSKRQPKGKNQAFTCSVIHTNPSATQSKAK